MKTHHPGNERIKRQYLAYLKDAQGQSESSLGAVAKAMSRFEAYTKYRDFKAFNIEQARAFKRHLAEQISQRTGAPLSKATLYSTLNALRLFFRWLADRPGFRSRVSYSDAEYFRPSEKDARIATAHRERPVPTPEQIEHVLRTMPSNSEIDRRDQAIIAFTILTGARDSAIASLKLKHIDVVGGLVEQDAREVKTKASKTITTWFFPVGDLPRQIVVDWVDYLLKEKLWGRDDPLFPATLVALDDNCQFAPMGIARKHWTSAAAIRKIFKDAFEKSGLRYHNPHSFRKTLVQLAFRLKLAPEQFKAWSQNLGHEDVLTTFTSYGTVSRYQQAEIMRGLGSLQRSTDDDLRTPGIVISV